MNLDKRVLALSQPPMSGPDVDRLHEELSRVDDRYRQLLPGDVDPEGRRRFGDATRRAVVAFQEAHRERLQSVVAGSLDGTEQVRWSGEWGVVDAATAQVLNEEFIRLTAPFIVGGRVEYEDGTPAQGVQVRVYDRDIATFRDELNESGGAVANAAGVFPDVRYTARKHARGEGRGGATADIVVAVTDAEHQRELELVAVYRQTGSPRLDEQPVRDLVLGWAAAPLETLRIIVRRHGGARTSEYERIMAALRPLLIREITPDGFDEAKHRDVTFAARETRENRALIQTMVAAWRLAKVTNLPPEAFYALMRDGLPVEKQALPDELDALLSFGRAVWEPKFDEAFTLRLIPESMRDQVPSWMERLDAERAHASLRATSDKGERATLADVLRYAGIPADQQVRFAALLNQADPAVDLWTKTADDLGWRRAQVDAVRQAIELSDVVLGHAPLLNALHEHGGVPGARALAAWERRDLEALIAGINPPGDTPGDTIEARRSAYLTDVETALRSLYPAQFVSRALRGVADEHLRRTTDWLDGMLLQTANLPEGVPPFDLHRTPATGYLREYGDRIFDGVDDETRTLRSSELKRVQRVYQLASTPEQMAPLLQSGLDSARQITRFSPEHFARQYGDALGGIEAAQAVHAKAGYIQGTLLNLFIDARKLLPTQIPPERLPSVMHTLGTGVRIPALDELFGSDDLCACASCLSVLSPAAYFVDLLQFIDLPISGSSTTNLDVLLKRRPDLAHIQLTCENTNTRIPHVDLVNEILASYVAHEKPFAYNDPVKGVVNAKAEELRVNPIPLTDAAGQAAATAHERLQTAVFPLNLPYHHWLTVIRLYLAHFGVRRETLMRRFQPDDDLDTEMAIAAETLGLSPEDFEVITVSNFDGSSSTLAPTLESLFGFVETVAAGTAPANHVTPEFATTDPRRRLIKAVQNFLKNVSTSAGLTPAIRAAIKVNGKFDAPTLAAVTIYRTDHGLPGPGGTESAFWGALDAEGNRPLSVLMCHAPMFLRQTGVTFDELTALVQTTFLNPLFNDRVYFSTIGVTPEELMAFMQSGLATPPPAMLAKVTAAGISVTDFMNHVDAFRPVIVLNTPPSALCDLDQTTICHMDGSLLKPAELLTIQQAIRLWRKLGWTLHETDLVLSAFPFSDAFTLILRLADMKRLIEELKIPVDQLMALWRDIDTWDEASLYERLFRSKTAQSLDPLFKLNDVRREIEAFASGGGTPPLLVDHAALLLAAFRIGADDLTTLRAGLATGALSLANVSALYRQVVLARALELTVPDYLTLAELHGSNPLAPPLGAIESHALSFVRKARAVQASGFSVPELAYLVAHRADPRNAALLTAEQQRSLIASIRVGLEEIQLEYVAKDDPQGDQFARQVAAIVAPPHADTLARMVYSRVSYSQLLPGIPAGTVFPIAVVNKIRYDQDRQELVFAGVMTPGEQAVLKAPAFVTTLPVPVQGPFATAVDALFAAPETFAKAKLLDLMPAGELMTVLRASSSLTAAGTLDLPAVATKVDAVLLRVRRLLSLSLIKRSLSERFQLEGGTVAALLEDAEVLTDLNLGSTNPAIEDFLEMPGSGVDADYFANPTLTGAPAAQRVDATIAFNGVAGLPAGIGAAPFSVRWKGFIYSPLTEEFTFVVRVRDAIRLWLNDALVLDEWTAQPLKEFTVTAKLRKGTVNTITIEYAHLAGDITVELWWRSPSTNLAVVPATALYTDKALDTYVAPLVRIEKIARIVNGLTLSAADAAAVSRLGFIDWNLVPVSVPATPAAVVALFDQWRIVHRFAVVRDQVSRVDGAFAGLLASPTLDIALDRFAELTGADRTDVQAFADAATRHPFNTTTLTYANQPPQISDLEWWSGLRQSGNTLRKTGAPAAGIIEWGMVKDVTRVAPAPPVLNWWALTRNATARARAERIGQDLKRLVKAKYDEETWRSVARPINDQIRSADRDALIGYVMAMPAILDEHFDTADELFAFFLIDVKMDPCMETSRIQQGIATIQLALQRWLMGAEEPTVMASSIDRELYKRMQSYAIWHPSREVLIHTEKYIRWDLLDRKSEAYAGFERDLRKQDMTQVQAPELARGRWAETAFMNFLEKLDEVAKLEICGVYHDEAEKVLHVFGRTRTAPYRFYYRRSTRFVGIGAQTGLWTAWERLPLDVDAVEEHGTGSTHLFDNDFSGVHLMPVKWNRRLYLVWPQFRLMPDDDYNASIPPGFDRVSRWDLKLAWSELWNGTWSPKQVSMSTVSSRPRLFQGTASIEQTVLTTRIEEKHVHWVPEETGIWPIDLALEFGGVGHYEYYSTYKPGHAKNELIEGPGIDVIAANDYVSFTTDTKKRAVASYLPAPDEHFFTVRQLDDRLLVTPLVRFFTKSVSGKEVTRTKLSVTIKQGDKITFREKTKDPVEKAVSFEAQVYEELGVFMLGACKVRDVETSSSPSTTNYYVFTPPVSSRNSYQGCRHFNPFYPHFAVGISEKRILDRTEWLFNVIGKEDVSGFQYQRPFFFQDRHRTYLVTPMKGRTKARPKTHAVTHNTATPATTFDSSVVFEQATWGKYAIAPEFMFHLHSDPHVCEFIRRLNRDGLFPLLASATQQLADTTPQYFEKSYKPTSYVAKPYPDEHVTFEMASAYGQYHWELFLYAPMRAWAELLKSFQFETGEAFLRMVADIMSSDTSKPVPDRVWQFVPFQTADPVRIQESLGLLLYTGSDPVLLQKKALVQETIQDWLSDPFNPHLIARRRTSAYMMAVILDVCRHYLAAADFEFSRYTMESLPRALQYLIIVMKVLGGVRPSPLRTAGKIVPETYQSLTLKGHLSPFSQFSLAIADLETELPFTHSVPVAPGTIATVTSIQTMYFCIPPNDEWARMWDRVADRLYKIRHCMNIEGVVQELPLFPEPIDPMLAVEARARGIDVSSVFDDRRAPRPHHEFNVVFEKALRMVEDVRAFAVRFESLIERGEADELAQLRVEQEAEWLKAYLRRELVQASQQQTALREAVEQSRAATQARFDFYDAQIKRGLIQDELAQRSSLVQAREKEVMAQGAEVVANLLSMIPEAHAQGVSSGTSFGGLHLSAAAKAVSAGFKALGAQDSQDAAIAALNAQTQRRFDEWANQREIASIDLKRVDDELAAARLQENVAVLRIENHDKTTANTRAVLDFYRQKFFNADQFAAASEDLYPDYFQLFQLAYQYARQAEACCRFQFGLVDLNVIQFGYWNNARKGLLAGEHLHLALKQLERIYLDADKREYEIRKDVSLAMLDPMAFLNLKYTGRCEFEIPETFFDADYPGQYMRRLRAASVTIPCVVGRYTSVNCTLTLLKNKTRLSSEVGLAYEEDLTQQDPRFTTTFAAVQSIVTSHAQNDSGVFEPELKDGRFFPFRGGGVISRWRADLPLDTNSLDRHSLTDFLLHLPFTAREGGEGLKAAAWKARETALKDPGGLPQRRLLSAKFESRDDWHRFLHPSETATAQTLAIELTNETIGPLFKEVTIAVSDVDVYVHFKSRTSNAVYQAGPGVLSVQVAHRVAGVTTPPSIKNLDSVTAVLDGAPHGSAPLAFDLKPGVVSTLLVEIPETSVAGIDPSLIEKIAGTTKFRLKPDAIEDISIVLRYVVK